MDYSIIFDSEAINFLEKLDKQFSHQILKKLTSAKSNPHHFFEKLVSRTDFKLRVGDYRVIADIDDKSGIIFISMIGHRKNIYEKI